MEKKTNDSQVSRTSLALGVLALIYLPALISLAITALLSVRTGLPFAFFLRDPTYTLDGHPLTGVQSNLGILVWCAAAATCFFSTAILRRARGDKTIRSFFLWSGVITSVLFLDDFFLIHDDLAYRYLRLDEKIIVVGYGLALVLYIVRFRRIIFSSEYPLFCLALGFFGSSVAVDLLQDRWESPWRIFFEDGLKFLGIVSWSGYFIRTCFHSIAESLNCRPVDVRS